MKADTEDTNVQENSFGLIVPPLERLLWIHDRRQKDFLSLNHFSLPFFATEPEGFTQRTTSLEPGQVSFLVAIHLCRPFLVMRLPEPAL